MRDPAGEDHGPPERRRTRRWIMAWVVLVVVLQAGLLLLLERRLASSLDRQARASAAQVGRQVGAVVRLALASTVEAPRWEQIGRSVPVQEQTSVEVVGSSGRVLWGSDREARGKRRDAQDPRCVACHGGRARPARAARTPTITEDPPGYLFAAPLMNEARCRACHGAERAKLGVVFSWRSSASLAKQLRAERVVIAGAGAVVLVLTLLAGGVLSLRVARRPPERAAAAAPPAAAPLKRSSTGELRLVLREEEEQRENLQNLYDIAEEISEQASPDDRRRRVVQLVRAIFKSDSLLISGHFHPESNAFHGLITYCVGDALPVEVPYPHEGIERIALHYDQELVDRWLRGELNMTTRIRAGNTVAYPLERHGTRLGLFLVPARPQAQGRPTGANPEVVQALRKHLSAALELAELQRHLLRQERLATIGATVAGLAHCLKNTLQGLRGGQYVVDRALRIDDQELLDKGWRTLKSGVGHIERLVLDMLLFASERPLRLALDDPNATLQEVAEMLRETAEQHQVVLETDLEPQIGKVALDQHALYRAVLNLTTNAIDACVESERGDRVLLRSRKRSGCVVLSVQDNGVGIPPEILRRVSERFFTTKSSRGTGLGLPVVEKIAKLHGGSLEIESVLGEGSTFHILIPR